MHPVTDNQPANDPALSTTCSFLLVSPHKRKQQWRRVLPISRRNSPECHLNSSERFYAFRLSPPASCSFCCLDNLLPLHSRSLPSPPLLLFLREHGNCENAHCDADNGTGRRNRRTCSKCLLLSGSEQAV
jgi:hypothetical protein